jgi:hypothetical protein
LLLHQLLQRGCVCRAQRLQLHAAANNRRLLAGGPRSRCCRIRCLLLQLLVRQLCLPWLGAAVKAAAPHLTSGASSRRSSRCGGGASTLARLLLELLLRCSGRAAVVRVVRRGARAAAVAARRVRVARARARQRAVPAVQADLRLPAVTVPAAARPVAARAVRRRGRVGAARGRRRAADLAVRREAARLRGRLRRAAQVLLLAAVALRAVRAVACRVRVAEQQVHVKHGRLVVVRMVRVVVLHVVAAVQDAAPATCEAVSHALVARQLLLAAALCVRRRTPPPFAAAAAAAAASQPSSSARRADRRSCGLRCCCQLLLPDGGVSAALLAALPRVCWPRSAAPKNSNPAAGPAAREGISCQVPNCGTKRGQAEYRPLVMAETTCEGFWRLLGRLKRETGQPRNMEGTADGQSPPGQVAGARAGSL